ncbi:hypothetical protein [Pectobacterium zantedeschiae]|uniref:hypothetical protein n=1 Tax=Pectobacterium zantedeschiae TaxID=2034769 RepID=UPI001F5CCF44|nr:hypothetical protein [Pectobacterium zantedeschiae]
MGVNTGVQLTGKDPFSYVDAIMAGVTAAATTGKGIIASTPINMGGAAIGSSIKGEDPTNAVAGAGGGTIIGGIGGEVIKGATSKFGKDAISDLTGIIGGGYISEEKGNFVKDQLDEKGKMEIKTSFSLLIKLMLMCMILFLFFDFISVLLASVIIYFKKDFFPFSWREVFSSFFESGYVGGLILGVGIWIKVTLEERKVRRESTK